MRKEHRTKIAFTEAEGKGEYGASTVSIELKLSNDDNSSGHTGESTSELSGRACYCVLFGATRDTGRGTQISVRGGIKRRK